MADIKTGWEQERRTHFDEIVVNYDRIRPEYPKDLFEDIFAYMRGAEGKRALEIGPGTGKATTPFLDAGYDVTAVELGANMADFLRDRFAGCANLQVIVAPFEDVELEENAYDVVYAASSIHWLDANIACPKAHRILKSGGAFAMLRHDLVPADGEALYEAIQELYAKHYVPHYPSARRPVKKTREDFMKPTQILYSYGFEDLGRYGFQDVSMRFYEATRTFEPDEYIAFQDTMADHRGLPESARQALYQGIREAILRHGGQYSIDHIFRLYIGRKP